MSGRAITDLCLNQCRYPVTPDNAPRHFFCGEPVEHEKSPYCPAHAALCFDRRAAEMKRAHAEHMAVMRLKRKTVKQVTSPSSRFDRMHPADVYGRDS